MNLSPISKKYFKLAVGIIKKETAKAITCDCPLCGDTKGRLSLTAVNDEDGVCGCFNAGCELSDQPLPLSKALELINPNLVPQYKNERFKTSIQELKESRNLNDILNTINTGSTRPKKVEAKPILTEGRVKTSPRSELVIPDMFLNMLQYAKDVPQAVDYIEGRKLKVEDDWLFSKEKFVTIFEKSYFVDHFLFIPLWQNGKLRGFYTRSILEKRFSTITFPRGLKYWASKDFNPNETCYIFEGIMDAKSSGLENCAAMLSADLPEEFIEELVDPVFCFDNDVTGKLKALKYNKMGYKTFVWPETEEKDLNEILKVTGSIEANKRMIEANIYSGLKAQILLNLSNI